MARGGGRDLRSLVLIEAQRRQGDRVTSETCYYISSLPAEAQLLLQGVRSHWGIENALHWVLDMAFREDECRIRTGHAAHNMSILRRLALNLLRRETTVKGGIAAKRKQAGWNDSYLLKVLSNWNAIALRTTRGIGSLWDFAGSLCDPAVARTVSTVATAVNSPHQQVFGGLDMNAQQAITKARKEFLALFEKAKPEELTLDAVESENRKWTVTFTYAPTDGIGFDLKRVQFREDGTLESIQTITR